MSEAIFSGDDIFATLVFKPILITDLFNFHNGSGAAKKDEGVTPYIAASFQKNGVVGYVNKPKYKGGWLSLVKDGDGGAGKCFYQPVPFWPSNHVYALEPKITGLSDSALLCIAAIITHQCFPKYSRGHAINANRLLRQKIMVPALTASDGKLEVDWSGLTRLGDGLLAKAKEQASAARKSMSADADTLPELVFQPMLITKVFESAGQTPFWLNTNQVTNGPAQYPHVTNTALNNCVADFIAEQPINPNPGNAITLGIDTQVVAYQPAPFYGATKVFELRSSHLNEENAPILVTSLRKGVAKFSWGHKASANRLMHTRIMVPVTIGVNEDVVVDWEGMNRYGRSLRVRVERTMDAVVGTPRTNEQVPMGDRNILGAT